MPSQLHIFDFDNTLFRSPVNSPETLKKFEKATGLPWLISKSMSKELTKQHRKFIPMRSGWWGRAETLQPPIVPNPAPPEWFIDSTVKALAESKLNSDAVTLILTGRHVGLRQDVLRICAQGNLIKTIIKSTKDNKKFYESVDSDVKLHLLGDDGPGSSANKPKDTLAWKVWLIEQYVQLYSEVNKVVFWEDRIEHVTEFNNLNGLLAEQVIVNHVTD